ncbi:interferon-induced protein with tetratricopeptide repeats 1-like [Scleropages formosus]|uniref:Interferon-induced protein with tetratricopeptide repeats 1-like n=1 Tax=Scleropages formosus TaxID=113540 RepID=A0A8C9RMP2_SCLFO|nr:interferon-induced protein with tetratricopeptide repeats 1-like [Scleropages formosus]XP_018616351.2 interferon-induced protein with tetratricopeptide repeats 1-like [Scleropages formosus]
MALDQDETLKGRLNDLECHFTWDLRKNYTVLSDLQNRIDYEMKKLLLKQKGISNFLTFLAFTKYQEGLLEEALENLQKAEEDIRKHSEEDCEKLLLLTYGDLAWLYYHMSEKTKSMSYLEKLEDIKKQFSGESSSVLQAKVDGEKAWTLLKYSPKYSERAKECFQKALEQDPDESDWRAGYAIVLFRTELQCKSIEDSVATKELRRALEVNPGNPLIMALLAIKLVSYGKPTEGKELVEKISTDDPEVKSYLADFYQQYGSVEKAVDLLKEAIKERPNNAALHNKISMCYKKQRQSLLKTRDASDSSAQRLLAWQIDHLEKAISLRPSKVKIMMDLAKAYGEAKAFRKAEELFEKIFKVAEDLKDNLQAVYLCYGDFQLYQKKCESSAIKQYMKGSKIQNDTPEKWKCTEKLETIANRRKRRNHKDGEAFGILGYVHHTRGDARQAKAYYEQALKFDRGNTEYLAALWDLRLSLTSGVQDKGEKHEATEEKKTALSSDRDNKK